MKKRKYTGILARPIPQNDEVARKEALEELCALYGVAVPETVGPLTKALMAAHVPAFSPQPQSKKRLRRIGRKPKLLLMDLLRAWKEVFYLMCRRKIRITSACQVVWKKGYSDRCEFITFRKTICAVDAIPRDKLFDDEPGDNDIVKRFKNDLRLLRHLANSIEATLRNAANAIEAANAFVNALEGRKRISLKAMDDLPSMHGDIKDMKELLIELESGNFLGRN